MADIHPLLILPLFSHRFSLLVLAGQRYIFLGIGIVNTAFDVQKPFHYPFVIPHLQIRLKLFGAEFVLAATVFNALGGEQERVHCEVVDRFFWFEYFLGLLHGVQ